MCELLWLEFTENETENESIQTKDVANSKLSGFLTKRNTKTNNVSGSSKWKSQKCYASILLQKQKPDTNEKGTVETTYQ